jgi:hypothetical protein
MLDHHRLAIAVLPQAKRIMAEVTEQGFLRRMHS